MKKKKEVHLMIGYAGDDPGVSGSAQFPCRQCAAQVWLAPSGQRMMKAGAWVMCMECALSHAAEIISFDFAPGADEEYLAETLRRSSGN